MTQEGNAVVLVGAVELDLSVDTRLLPKGGHRTPQLHVGEQVSSHNYYLLGLAEISKVAFAVDASRVVPCPPDLPTPTADEVELDLFPFEEGLEMFD